MALTSGTNLGPYEIQSPLGAGGMGEVYRARDTRLDRTVAVKILPPHLANNPEARQRFEHEARAISSLNHPNICTLHDIGHQDRTDFLVMEYLEGETLADRLRRGPLPLEAVLKYGIEICEGLERAHKSAVIHRDLKPANIMLTKAGSKVMDFGLAKAVTPALVSAAAARDPAIPSTPTISLDSLSAPALTQAGTIMGTFQYLAPEVLQGNAADARSDIFSLGCVLYEMVTARPAFQGKSQISVLAAILEREPDPVASVRPSSPPALGSVIRACLAKDPEDRIQSAHDVKLQLKLVAETAEANAKPAVSGRITRSQTLAALSLVVLLIGAATIWWSRPQSHAMPEVPIMELSVSLLSEMSLSPLSAPIISPDGSAVVFVAKTPDRLESLYLRRLDTPVIRRLESTEMARHPFWSPDSASVGFFAEAQLKRVDIASGIVQVIAEASDGRGGAWNKDGVVIFSPRADSPLFRVDALGGKPRPLTELNGQPSHRWPSFLPDSQHFIYTAQPGAAPGGIFLASLGDPRGQLLTPEVVSGQVANGYLLFPRGTTVVSAKLDVTTAKLSGENTVVTQHVRVLPDRNLAEFSVSNNGVLTYAPGDINTFQLAWFDRTGHLLESINARDVRGELDLSPDGRRLLTDYSNPGGGQSVEIIDLQRGTATPVSGTLLFESPLWSPTGESVILGRNDIVRRWINGSERQQVLVKSSVSLYPDDWSKDGRWLLFERVDKQTNFDLMRLDMRGKAEPESYLQTPANEAHGRISPDGRWVAYVSDESGQAEVYVQSFPETGGGKWRISTQGGDQPFWRGDGGELYYLAPNLVLMAVPVRRGKFFDPGAPVKLFQTNSVTWGITGNRNSYVATPDGKRFLIQYIPEQVGGGFIGIVENWERRLKETTAPQGR
jgi:eukaryotic-like serine/threonine-protein kinase